MHNRFRMVTASFLTRNLLIHWLHGARRQVTLPSVCAEVELKLPIMRSFPWTAKPWNCVNSRTGPFSVLESGYRQSVFQRRGLRSQSPGVCSGAGSAEPGALYARWVSTRASRSLTSAMSLDSRWFMLNSCQYRPPSAARIASSRARSRQPLFISHSLLRRGNPRQRAVSWRFAWLLRYRIACVL